MAEEADTTGKSLGKEKAEEAKNVFLFFRNSERESGTSSSICLPQSYVNALHDLS